MGRGPTECSIKQQKRLTQIKQKASGYFPGDPLTPHMCDGMQASVQTHIHTWTQTHSHTQLGGEKMGEGEKVEKKG